LGFDELKQTFAISAHVAVDFGQCWEFFAFGLAQEKARILQNLKADARMLAGLSKTISTLQHYCARWPLTGDEHTRLGTIFRNHVCQYICATETDVLGVDRVEEAVTQLAEVHRTLQAKYLAEIPDVSKELADFSETMDRQSTDLEAEATLREAEVRERACRMGQLLDELKQCEVPRLQEAFRRLAARTGIKLKTKAYGTAVADWIGRLLETRNTDEDSGSLGKEHRASFRLNRQMRCASFLIAEVVRAATPEIRWCRWCR